MSQLNTNRLPGIHLAPNIQGNPSLYEVENIAADPNRLIEATMQEIAPWKDKIVLDLGAGTGFHISHFQKEARHVFAVEPHDASRLLAMKRVAELNLERVSVMIGSAAQVWLPDKSVDIVHVRFAYFWGPGCEPGLIELKRIIKPGGTAFIIDNDLKFGTFANWVSRCTNLVRNPDEVEKFWQAQNFGLIRIPSQWQFQNRTDLEAVVRLEFSPELASQLLSEHSGNSVDYHYCLYYHQY